MGNLNLSLIFTAFLALGYSSGTWAGTLSDPTRPPKVWLDANGIKLATSQQEVSTGVQLIMIGPTSKFAIIDGQIIKPGKYYKGSKVLDIKPDGVVTRDSSKSLKLIPAVRKTVASSESSKKSQRKKLKKQEVGE